MNVATFTLFSLLTNNIPTINIEISVNAPLVSLNRKLKSNISLTFRYQVFNHVLFTVYFDNRTRNLTNLYLYCFF